MQTFLPYSDFELSAQVLDSKRLNKQIVEVQQIINSINNGTGWKNHPAVKMWVGYVPALALYGEKCFEEYCRRYKRVDHASYRSFRLLVDPKAEMPPWLGDNRLHISHRSNLLRKDFVYYSMFFKEDPNLPYYWPI